MRLFHRITRRLHPTAKGTVLAQQGRVLEEDLESLGSGLRKTATEIAGTLRVTMSALFSRQVRVAGAAHLPGPTSQTADQRAFERSGCGPDQRGFRFGDSHRHAGRFHLGRATYRTQSSGSARFAGLHAAPGYPQSLQALADHDCLLLFGSHGRQDVWRLHDADGEGHAIRVQGKFESNYGELLRDACVAGQGIAIHSLWHIAEDLRAGRLEVMLPHCRLSTTAISAVVPHRWLLPPRVGAFVDFLISQFGDAPWEHGRKV